MMFGTSKRLIDSKRAHRDEVLATAAPYDASVHNVFLKASATEIVKNIESRKWCATQVLEPYITRAALAHQTTNCGTEIRFAEARLEARQLDEEFAKTGKLRGPLHGVPVSFKDQFDISGLDTTIGFTQWANKVATADAHLVAQFKAAGAVIIIKTNVPQTMMAFECGNPLWGSTKNPWNQNYTSGGSSGGEGAILAMDGSAIGVGSDIGGSLRIPASYCGVYSLKPSVGRINVDGARGPSPGFEAVKFVVGPMSRSVEDVELVCRTVFGVQNSHPEPAPIPYRDVILPPKLKFGYYTSDCYIKASPANKRAVLETVEALRRDGHECIEFEVPNASKAFNLFIAFISSDGYKTMLSHLGPDKQEECLFLVTLGPKLPSLVRKFASWAVRKFMKDDLFADSMNEARVRTTRELMECVAERDEYVKLFYEQVWNKHQFDGIIAPVQAMPVIGHGDCATFSPLAAATILYNIVDSPAGHVPVTRVDPTKDKVTEEWKTGPGLGSSILESGLYRGNLGKKAIYDPEGMKGIPVGVQVVGRKWEDEKVLAMMHVVDKALGPRGFGPGMWTDQSRKNSSDGSSKDLTKESLNESTNEAPAANP
jgi:amidase